MAARRKRPSRSSPPPEIVITGPGVLSVAPPSPVNDGSYVAPSLESVAAPLEGYTVQVPRELAEALEPVIAPWLPLIRAGLELARAVRTAPPVRKRRR